jgi:hypothetical protein
MSGSSSRQFPVWTTRQVILATIFIVAVILVFWLVYQFRLVVLSIRQSTGVATTKTNPQFQIPPSFKQV